MKTIPLSNSEAKQLTLGSGPNTRQEELEARFRAFHAKHPMVFSHFMYFANKLRGRCGHYSAYGIMHMVRYQSSFSGDTPKIGNNLVPYYARLAMATDPRLEEFFTTCRLTTEDKRPHDF